ncbi:MAG: hypothetical protein AM326_03275 [Candidatus Thorarchaeota archaeon SMTZ-45]|nr:MAG: hypothetical protein AM326_03275 [Candidatus Thorarchaeota archaeon SMTZ-45]
MKDETYALRKCKTIFVCSILLLLILGFQFRLVQLAAFQANPDSCIPIDYADSTFDFDRSRDGELDLVANEASQSIIVEYAESILNLDLSGNGELDSAANSVSSRITVEYADSILNLELNKPEKLGQVIGGPSIEVNTPNGDYYTTAPVMDVDFTDVTGLNAAYYKVDSYTPLGVDTNGWFSIFTDHSGTNHTTDFTMDSVVWGSLNEGSHTAYFKAFDDSENVNDGASYHWQFYKDTSGPSITLNIASGSLYSSPPILDVDFMDAKRLDDAFYKIDSYAPLGMDTTGWFPIFLDYPGASYSTDFLLSGTSWDSLDEGSHTIYFKAWDDIGNVNDGPSPSWQFYKDISGPSILVNSPAGTYHNSPPTLDVDFSDAAGLDAAYYKIDSYSPLGMDTSGWTEVFQNRMDVSYTANFIMDDSVWASLSEGSHIVHFKAWDDLGNVIDGSSISLQFYKDTTAPVIIVNTPSGNFYTSPPSVDVDFEDPEGLDAAYYRIDSYTPTGIDTTGWIQIFENHPGTNYTLDFILSSALWDSLETGSYAVYFKAWDNTQNVNDGPSPAWQFFKYAGVPIISVNLPSGNYYNTSPTMDVDFLDPTGLDAAYYKVDSYSPTGTDTTGWIQIFTDHSGISYTSSFKIDGEVWNLLSEGLHTVYFKAWNHTESVNDGEHPSWQFFKDTVPPAISLESPSENGVYQSGTSVVLSVSGHSSCCFYWDEGVFSDVSSTIFSLPSGDGVHTIYLKAEDEAGNRRLASFSFITDDTPPTAEITGINDHASISGVVTIKVTPHDENGIDFVSLLLNDEQIHSKSSDFTFRFDTTDFSVGEYLLTIRVFDIAGNVYEREFSISIGAQEGLWEQEWFWPMVGVVASVCLGLPGALLAIHRLRGHAKEKP